MVDSDVEFIMNGTNHLNKSIVSYPFAIFGEHWKDTMQRKQYPNK
jgi:virginiamycin A acetyltransferase